MRKTARTILLGSAAMAFVLPIAAYAQSTPTAPVETPAKSPTEVLADQAPAERDAVKPASDIVVTGSRISKQGYSAPTPVTVVSASTLERSAVSNIPDALNKLPQLTNSRSNNQSIVITPQAPLGGNYLNLRGVGINRVLVLFDGQRLAPTTFEGAVDTNIMPQLLIKQVDIVTAGASAGYGSDAVSGVVNFVLDKNFSGLKGVVDSGISSRGDDGQKRFGMAIGHTFLDGKLHIEASAEYFKSDGIDAAGKLSRFQAPFPMAVGAGTAANPYATIFNARFATQSFGGVINSGPLKGMQFLPGGALAPFNAGTTTGTSGINIGGDGAYHNQMWLTPEIANTQAFSRASYEFSPSLTGYVYGNFAASNTYQIGATQSENATTIYSGNAFLTPSEQASLGGTPSFSIGRRIDEAGGQKTDGHLRDYTFGTGLDGSFGSGWKWDAHYTHSYSRLTITQQNQIQLQHYAAAVDAVRDGSGNIVCRVSLTNPGLYPGCVPLDLFGAGSPSAAALAYVLQPTTFTDTNKLDEANASLSGSPFSLPAGAVNVALGIEYRHASLLQTTNADPALPVDFTGLRSPIANRLFNTGQVGSAQGENNVKEAFLEAAVPLLKDIPFIQKLDLNGAARYTDYSTSGSVVTWKVGANYVPTDGIRFRGTISRDIRAPTLYELYAGSQFNRNTITDSLTHTTNELVYNSQGNPNLKPEIGHTKTVGVVLQPRFIHGFNLSLDYFALHISQGIASIDGGTVLNLCNASGGTSPFCSQVIRPISASDTTPANFPTQVNVLSINLANEVTRGFDFEVSQRFDLSSKSAFDLHLLSSYVPKRTTQTLATQAPYNLAGAIQVTLQSNAYLAYPKLSGTFQADYSNGPFDLFLQERYVGPMDRNWNPLAVFADHHYQAVYYTDATVSIKLGALGGRTGPNNATLFFNVNNLFNRQPPLVPDISSPGLLFPTNQEAYDVVGRFMSAGVRFNF